MTHPPIQIVDKNDKPIGQSDMLVAHKKGLVHRIVRVMAEDAKGRILLQKRSSKVQMPNCWDHSAAGHVDVDEEYLAAAKRELKEELGVTGVKLKEIAKYYAEVRRDGLILKRFNKLYKVLIEHTPKDIQLDEVSEVKWFTLVEIKKLIDTHPETVTEGLTQVIEQYY